LKLITSVVALGSLVLSLVAVSTASAAPTCSVSDVTIDGESSLACAGHFAGNASLTALNSFEASDWTGDSPPNPLDGWLFGGKWDWNTGELDEAGVLPAGALVSFGIGNFTIDISPYAEVVVSFKQATGHAYYYFQNDGDGTYQLSWVSKLNGNPEDDVFSNLNLFVRGVAVPEPGSMALLGLSILGVGIARRRRQAS
jgi:hypothetical protein